MILQKIKKAVAQQTNQRFLYKMNPAHLQVTHPDPATLICKLFSNLKTFIFPIFTN